MPSGIATCDTCGHEVWRALSSPVAAHVICERCALTEMEASGDDYVIDPPTLEQVRDILRWRAKKGRQ